MTTSFESLKQMKKDYDEVVEKEGRKLIDEAFKAFFEKHADVLAVRWNQYTPSFNDGDACTFRASLEDYPDIQMDGICRTFEDRYHWEKHCDQKRVEKIFADIPDVDEDILEAVFGDGVEVTVSRHGITTEPYDHD